MTTTIVKHSAVAEANMAEANVCAVDMGWVGGAKVESTLK